MCVHNESSPRDQFLEPDRFGPGDFRICGDFEKFNSSEPARMASTKPCLLETRRDGSFTNRGFGACRAKVGFPRATCLLKFGVPGPPRMVNPVCTRTQDAALWNPNSNLL